ncbi:MAG TPA: hypothetical protein VIV34_12030 [Pseudolabrys sp.]
MNRHVGVLPVLFVIAGAAAWTTNAQAMPHAPIIAPTLGVPVAGGCGLGVHRGQFDGCEHVYGGYYPGYYRGYRNNYYAGFGRGGLCGGRGTHLACNFYGICGVACN